MKEDTVVIKGAGDLASGIAHRLFRSGFRVIMTELAQPTAIRRAVAFAEAVYTGEVVVEGVRAKLARNPKEAAEISEKDMIAVLVDESGESTKELAPVVLVDATMAKRNTGTSRDDAAVVIGIGPGFIAGQDVHAVVETQRGHYLGRVILEGAAASDSGVPGSVMGVDRDRVLRATAAGRFKGLKAIGEPVRVGETVAYSGDTPVVAKIGGVLRGILHDGLEVYENMKVGDVDPRGVVDYCFTISDKSRAVAGGVLEAILYLERLRNRKY